MTILSINFTCHSFSQKAILEQQRPQFCPAFEWTDAFLYNGANGSTGVISCLDSKTINTLTDCPIKSIVGQTTSEGGDLRGRAAATTTKVYSNKTLLG